MKTDKLKQLIQLLNQHGYHKLYTINKDDSYRFNGIISDQKGKKYFVKAVVGKNNYNYKSLYMETKITQYLSEKTKESFILYKGYRLHIPYVANVIDQDEILCLITNYVDGKKLLDEKSDIQAEIILATLELLKSLNKKINISTIKPFLKNYTRKALLFFLPLRFLKAFIISPFAFRGLTIAFWKTLPLFLPFRQKYGLIHPDINISNITYHKKNIYLTDWEEAGWGIWDYNKITPLCVHWQNKTLKNILFSNLKSNGQKNIVIPLLAYRVLMLFNQNIERRNKKRERDLMVLKFLTHVK